MRRYFSNSPVLPLFVAATLGACFVYPNRDLPPAPSDAADETGLHDAGPPDADPVEAAPVEPPEPVDNGPCGKKGKVDLEVRRDGLYRGLQSGPPTANVQLVDACQGALPPTRVDTELVRLRPTDGKEFYFLVTPLAPTENYYPSASELWVYPYPDMRGDLLIALIPKGAVADPQVNGSPIPDAFKGVYDASKVHFVLDIRENAPCLVGGHRPVVVGHPEARLRYTNGSFEVDPELAETPPNPQGFVFVSGVNPGPEPVEFAGTNGGCKLAPPQLFVPVNTGKYPLVAGTVTGVSLVSTRVVEPP